MSEKITSIQNPGIKNILKLQQKSRERREQNLMVIEGFREINLAMTSGFAVQMLYVCPEIAHSEELSALTAIAGSSKITEVSQEVFEKIAYREGSDGLLALATPLYRSLDELQLSDNPLIVVLEAVEKPGNLGAILRTADAAKVDAVVICDPLCDIYNPNTIRASIGCVFTNQVVTCTTGEALDYFQRKKIKTFAAALTAQKFYHETDFTVPCALVMGTEAFGLTGKWLDGATAQIKIPMLGRIDSLNVSTSTAILVFEAKRQRKFIQ